MSGEVVSTTGIVLAGGRSARFQAVTGGTLTGASKLDADLEGRSVLDRSIDAVAAACAEVVVVGRGRGDRLGIRYVPDAVAFEGPLAGIVLGLRTAADSALVVGGDTPLANADVLRLLIGRLQGPDEVHAATLADGDHWRPLPLALRVKPADRHLNTAYERGERSIRQALDGLRMGVVPEAEWRSIDPDGDTLLDVDLVEDLELARSRLERRI